MDSDNGGCVANAAFAFVQAMGFETIILVGQDLAYTDNKIHAGNRIDDRKINTNQDNYVRVKGVDGDNVYISKMVRR